MSYPPEVHTGDSGEVSAAFRPHDAPSELHFHKTISESFFVLSGRIRLHDGSRWVDAVAGDFRYVPEGGIHGFRNTSGEPASMLILLTPGAPREDYWV